MTALGPRTEAALKDGPQLGNECPNCHGTGKVMRPAFRRGTGHLIEHGCHICKGHGKLLELPEDFARRVALIAVEEERERCARTCEDLDAAIIMNEERSASAIECAAAIREGR